MLTGVRRVTITVHPDIAERLKETKKECYFTCTQNDMLKDLIARGLASLQDRPAQEKGDGRAGEKGPA